MNAEKDTEDKYESYFTLGLFLFLLFTFLFLFWQLLTAPNLMGNCERLCSELINKTYDDNQTNFYNCVSACYENH